MELMWCWTHISRHLWQILHEKSGCFYGPARALQLGTMSPKGLNQIRNVSRLLLLPFFSLLLLNSKNKGKHCSLGKRTQRTHFIPLCKEKAVLTLDGAREGRPEHPCLACPRPLPKGIVETCVPCPVTDGDDAGTHCDWQSR